MSEMNIVLGERKKRKYKRKLTEERKNQNRTAQQRYREKHKKLREQAVFESSNINIETTGEVHSTSIIVPQTPLTPYFNPTDRVSVHAAVDVDVCVQNGDECQPEWFHLASTSLGADSQPAGSTPKVPMTGVLENILQQEGDKDIDSILAFASAKQLNLRQIIVAGLRALKAEGSESTDHDNSCPRRILGFDHYPSQQPSSLVPSVSSLPTLFESGIFLRHQTIHQAYDQNARAIGLSLGSIMGPNCTSPFHASTSTTILPPGNSIPPDLRPTPSQIHFPHHPFIDLVPFPWFRDRFITLSLLRPPPLDRLQLKRDILSEGLICWKSRARSVGQPWDRRSWEVAPWFLEKWGWLIEEQGQVEEQSKWWRELRSG